MGKGSTLSKVEMKNLLVYNLRWFGPDDSTSIIQAALSSGLLQIGKDGEMRPTFDLESIKVEVGYRPPEDFDTNQMARPLFERLIEVIMDSGLDKKETIRSINRRGDEKNLLFPCAAIHVGLERGIDMSRFYGEVENSIRFGER
jgi:hypothetical protein